MKRSSDIFIQWSDNKTTKAFEQSINNNNNNGYY